VGLFKPGLFDDDILYLDLDVVITDSLLPLVALLYEAPGLWARDDFSYSVRKPRKGLGADTQRLLGGEGCINSSVMLWRGDVAREVWDKFTPKVMDVLHGDQNFITQVLWPEGIRLIPDALICSYKYQIMHGIAPAPIVVFHGDPKPDQLRPGDAIRVIWES
jgi:lipopolysaccharide biosynthesis glycosyltransferase